MFIQGNISLRVRKPFGAVVATSGEVPGLISKNCDSVAAFAEASGFGFFPGVQPTDLIAPQYKPDAPASEYYQREVLMHCIRYK
jgi:hypothetical protein